MPQLVKKRRSGWAVLAVGALVASILAVGASPAAAEPISASNAAAAAPDRTACLGPATDNAGFDDVAMGGSHYTNIQCLAHYGVTTGRAGGTQYGPHDNVTRSQMALFLSRMAGVAGVALDDAMGAGFTDLNGIGADRVDAINRLVNAGIMTGSGNDTFSPLASVSRAEMAMWLVNFLVAFTADNPTGEGFDVDRDRNDGTYTVMDGETEVEAVYFGDSRQTHPVHVDSAIGAAFQLGITTGYSDLTFRGANAVSRQEMASFIMRTLAHTNTRPAGTTSQAAGSSVQVSVRTAEFAPVANAPVDLFGYAYPDFAFDDDGGCVEFVSQVAPGRTACEIDSLDSVTDGAGNAVFNSDLTATTDGADTLECGTSGTFPTGGTDPGTEADITTWAWTGELGDEAEEDSVFETVVVRQFSRTPALKPHHAEVGGGLNARNNQLEARFGQVVNYTLQLHADPADPIAIAIDTDQGLMGEHIAVGPDSKGNRYQLRVSVSFLAYTDGPDTDGDGIADSRTRNDPLATVATAVSITPSIVAPNSDGALTIPITVADPHPGVNGDDMQVTFTLTPLGTDVTGDTYNNARLFDVGAPNEVEDDDADGYTPTFSDSIVFSDDGPDTARLAISAVGPNGLGSDYARAPGVNRRAASRVTITVIDQYGRPVPRFSVNAVSNGADSVLPFVQYFTTGSSGSYSIGYTYSGGPGTETVTGFGAVPVDHDSDAATPNQLPDRDTNDDGTLDFPTADTVQTADNLLPGDNARPAVTMYWADPGRLRSSEEDHPAADLLVIDVANKTFVINQDTPGGPHMYSWDSLDTFSVGGTDVPMALFETILTTSQSSTSKIEVTITTLSWTSYDYGRPSDRANWELVATCAERTS